MVIVIILLLLQALDKEVEKVVLFFLFIQGEIARKLLNLRINMKGVFLEEADNGELLALQSPKDWEGTER